MFQHQLNKRQLSNVIKNDLVLKLDGGTHPQLLV